MRATVSWRVAEPAGRVAIEEARLAGADPGRTCCDLRRWQAAERIREAIGADRPVELMVLDRDLESPIPLHRDGAEIRLWRRGRGPPHPGAGGFDRRVTAFDEDRVEVAAQDVEGDVGDDIVLRRRPRAGHRPPCRRWRGRRPPPAR